MVNRSLSEQTRKVLATLTPREEKVLKMRFGIGENSSLTLEDIGQMENGEAEEEDDDALEERLQLPGSSRSSKFKSIRPHPDK